jgi:phosphoribosylamine--glycine ligase
MNILVVGGGGREHALAWKMAQSPRVAKVFVAPGNGGTAREPGLTNIPGATIADLAEFARQGARRADDRRPGSSACRGHRGHVPCAGLRIFGVTKAAAQLESSKDFREGPSWRGTAFPTGRHRTFSDAAAARDYVSREGAPIVVKADGLAAGKGVVVAQSVAERTRRSTRCSSDIRWAPPVRAW